MHDIIELGLKRGVFRQILASRIYHGDFTVYHDRFHYHDTILSYNCGQLKSLLHFFFYKKSNAYQLGPKVPIIDKIIYLLGIIKGTTTLVDWITSSRFFIDICKLYARLEEPS